jgi:hypothetical protein
MRGLDRAACGHLSRIKQAGLDPRSIMIRSSFARLATPVDLAIYSDRQVPDRSVRPPATRLVRSRGCALQFYLTLLFEAQCQARAGGTTAPNTRPLAQPVPVGGDASWVEIVAASTATVNTQAANRSVSPSDRRLRQLRQALATLAADDIQLVTFTEPDAVRRYRSFRIMHEGGYRSGAEPIRYAVPRPAGLTFSFDARLFTNGWIHVLDDAELAFLCMVADLQARAGTADPVPVSGDERIGYYCLGPDGYQAHHLLSEAGLVRIGRNRGRQPNGTFKGYYSDDRVRGAPHSFGIRSDAFSRPALPTIIRLLRRLGG